MTILKNYNVKKKAREYKDKYSLKSNKSGTDGSVANWMTFAMRTA